MTYPQKQAKQTFQAVGEPPILAPYYDAPFAAAMKRFWKKYSMFSGRASRSEYWWCALASAAVVTILPAFAIAFAFATGQGLASTAGMAGLILLLILGLATIVPSLALTARRLHDANFSGWLLLLGLVPLGGIALLVMTILESNPAGQRFDPSV